ncbi:MAG: hypothetical protein J6A10_00905, partial [Peptococcaceae bacterium]|nr:hypothetical protein [Peptococcaceae bacterium]
YFQFEATEECALFGVNIELPCIVGLYNARLVGIDQTEKKYDVLFEDESEENKMYMVSLCFKNETELSEYKKKNDNHIEEIFHSAKNIREYVHEMHAE